MSVLILGDDAWYLLQSVDEVHAGSMDAANEIAKLYDDNKVDVIIYAVRIALPSL